MEELWKFYNNFKTVEKDFIELLQYVDLNEANFNTTSSEIRKIIQASCSFIELALPFLEKEVEKSESSKKPQTVSVASWIYNITDAAGCHLPNLVPIIQGQDFFPWEPDTNEENQITFSWWAGYNSSKHTTKYSAPSFFAAVNSVAALFVLTVFLTSKNQTDNFWHKSDYIKISTKKVKNPLSIYNNSTKNLRKQIWPNFKLLNSKE